MPSTGNSEKARNIIQNEDWTAVNDKFKLAEAVILDDFNSANELVRKIGMNGDVGKMEYRDWPLFKEFRKSEEFLETFQDVFKEPFHAEETQLIDVSGAELEKIIESKVSPTLSIDSLNPESPPISNK